MRLVLGHQARRHPESTSALSPDNAYADACLNANARGTATTRRSGRYQDASEDQKKHYEKCAEIRVVSGSAWVLVRRCGHRRVVTARCKSLELSTFPGVENVALAPS